jgi:microsomal dipeptidase-like Zn-dependent dipeptidase
VGPILAIVCVLLLVTFRTGSAQPVVVRAEAGTLHDAALIADLHLDSVMHNRDLTQSLEEGQADFPRLRQAGVDLAVLGIVSEGIPILGEIGARLVAWWWGWPRELRRSALTRALAQLDRIDQFAAADPGIRLVRYREDLDDVRAQRALGLLLSVEGAGAIDGNITNVELLYARGVRVMSLTHLRDNELGGSSSPTIPETNLYLRRDRGLSDFGRAVLGEMERLGMIVDLAHASSRTFRDILAAWSGPVIISHTAMAAIHPAKRNTTDEQLRAVAARGGLVGLMAHARLLGSGHLSALADNILHAARVAGIDRVSLGLDLDGLIPLPAGFADIRDLPRLTQLLLDSGVVPQDAKRILGENAIQFFRTALLPGSGSPGSREPVRSTGTR